MAEIKNALSAGEIVGNYQILGIAGAGGMGVVYKAFDQKLERTVALKFLPPRLISSTKEKARFLKEARAASSLDHPNIGVIHGIDETPDGRCYIVMAFYDGDSLARDIRGGPIPLEKAIDIARQMALGLADAHKHKIVHRDVKPSNVMVTPDGVAKIVDFGLARLVKSEIDTESGGTAGTIGYMSPEQTLGKLSDQRTDIWAWGIVLVEMLIGRNPFWRGSLPETINAILCEAPQGTEQIPAPLQPIVYHALAKDPDSRYQSCADILPDLESAKAEINSSMDKIDLSAPTRSIIPERFRNYVSAAAGPAAKHGSRAPVIAFVASVAVILLITGIFFGRSLREYLQSRFFTEPQKYIAVLPFDNIGNDPANEPLAEGLMDTMAGKLSNLDVNNRSLWVVPASEVRRRNINDPSTALRDLGATLAVKGSLEREGQDVHLTANLIDTKSLRQIGSVALENRSGDLLALQDETVSELARLMDVRRDNKEGEASGGGKPAAYEEYLEGVGYMQRYDKPGNLDSAIESLDQATRTDPRFALAYAQLGEAYRLKYQLDKDPKWLDQALLNCQKAAEIDSRVTAVYVTLGRIHEMSGKHDLAVQEFQRVLDFNSRDVGALSGIARSYENAGRIPEAEAAYRKAVALRPDYWDGYEELGFFYDRQGRYPEAIAQLQQAVSLTPDNAQIYANLGAVYSDADDPRLFPDAEKALEKSLELSPSYAAYANLGNLYYIEKRYAESATMTEKALQLNSNDYLVWNNLIVAYEWLNEIRKANLARVQMLEALQRYIKVQPQDALAQSLLAILYADNKLRQEAIIRMQTAEALAPNDPQVIENIGIAYEKLGERMKAINYIGEAVRKGVPLDQLKNDPNLRRLLADPDFQHQDLEAGPSYQAKPK
jgi:serine/threonine protein kinase/tetratricopeptide (TPR) repeat protein